MLGREHQIPLSSDQNASSLLSSVSDIRHTQIKLNPRNDIEILPNFSAAVVAKVKIESIGVHAVILGTSELSPAKKVEPLLNNLVFALVSARIIPARTMLLQPYRLFKQSALVQQLFNN